MSKSIEEAKQTRRNLLGQSIQKLKNTAQSQNYQQIEERKVSKAQDMIALGANIPSSIVYSERTIPPEKNRVRDNPVCASIVRCRSKNSSFDGQSRLDATLKSIGNKLIEIPIMNVLNLSSQDVSKIDASTIMDASRKNLVQSRPLSNSPTKPRKKQKRTPPPKREGQQAGRWTAEEHELFLEGLKMHGREWKKVAEKITTRTSAQIRSHAQKYFSKLAKESGHLHSYDGYIAGRNLLVSHNSMDTLGESSVETVKTNVTASSVSPSVMRRIERIMTNPVEVENEVESTLKSLRERYRQLQLRLQAQEEDKKQRISSSIPNRSIDSSNTSRVTISLPFSKLPASSKIRDSTSLNLLSTKINQPLHKVRTIGPATAALEQQQRCEDTNYVTDFVSRTLSSIPSKREFVNEELIALQVLGGALSDSTLCDESSEPSKPTLSLSESVLNHPSILPSSKKDHIQNPEASKYP